MKFLKDWLTECDNETFDPIRMLAVAGVLEYLILSAYTTIRTGAFDAQSFGLGLGSVLIAAGAAVGIKAKTEK